MIPIASSDPLFLSKLVVWLAQTNEFTTVSCPILDQHIFEDLVKKEELSVRRLCFGILGHQAQADEIAQDVLLKFWRRYEGRSLPKSPRAMLLTMAKNKSLSFLRWKKIRPWIGQSTPETLPALVDKQGSGETQLLEQEQHHRLRTEVAKLNPKYRVPILLRYVEGLSYEEIAEIIQRSIPTARYRVHLGIQSLRSTLREVEHD